ncbi:vesicle coat component, partial [Modicella reniformis]
MASRSATPLPGHQSPFIPNHASSMPGLDRMNSFSQEQGQLQPQHQEQPYFQQEYSPANQLWDPQGYSNNDNQQQQQHYASFTGQYVDSLFPSQDHLAPELEIDPVVPERINDPLNRHLGCPLVAFGFGGKIITWFPSIGKTATSASAHGQDVHVPLNVKQISDIIPKDINIANYPGPLLMDSSVQLKSKQKDVMKLIEDKINELGQSLEVNLSDAHRALIWKLLKVIARIDEAVSGVLRSVPIANLLSEAVQQKTSQELSGSIDTLQELLRQGNLATSIRHAIDSQLWAHALVISSHGNRELWNETVNSFITHELTARDKHANGRESLRVLYNILSGQSERAVSELVPQNLRAQYLENKDDLSKRVEIPDQSLSQWCDTLGLILSNRTEGDHSIVNSLGNLLRKEGWIEAAHICYLLSPQASTHSGPDTPNASMVFLGADHNPHALYPYYKNADSFQKTEIYEFGCALKSSGATGGLPFLQAYKLIYAWSLLDAGMFSEAARYLEAIENIVKSQPKGSPYYNSTLLAQMKDLTERMAASVHGTNAGPWLSKKVPNPVLGSIFDVSENRSLEPDFSSHEHADLTIIETASLDSASQQSSVEQIQQADSTLDRVAPEAPIVAQEQTEHHSNDIFNRLGDAAHILDHQGQPYDVYQSHEGDYSQAPTMEQREPENQHQDTGYYAQEIGKEVHASVVEDQGHNQHQISSVISEHHSSAVAVESTFSTQVVTGSEKPSQGTVPGLEVQDSGYDGGYARGPDGTGYGYDHQNTAAYSQDQYQKHEEVTYDSTHYYHQEEVYRQVQTTNGAGEVFEAEYNETDVQQISEIHMTETASQDHHQHQHITHAQRQTYGDTVPTLEQRSETHLLAENGAEVEGDHWPQGQQFQQGEQTHVAEEYGVEGHHNDHEGPSFEQGDHQQQQGYKDEEYNKHVDDQQQQYQQVEYQQGEYQQSEYQQGDYQQGDYQQGEYQQGEYQEGEYQQGEHQQGEYQEGEYQQADHQQGEYQQGEYQQDEHQQGEYQQADHQQ